MLNIRTFPKAIVFFDDLEYNISGAVREDVLLLLQKESMRQLGGVFMATSSIFAQVKITEPEQVEKFVAALEDSEKAQAKKKRIAPAIPIMRDINEIRKLMAKRFPVE